MAHVYIGYNVGGDYSPDQATEGSSSTTTLDVELRIDVPANAGGGGNSVTMSRLEITLILEAIQRYILDGRSATLTE